MGILIIVKNSSPRGRTRTNTDKRLLDADWGSSFKSEADRDKCAFIERKLKKEFNMDDSRVTAAKINDVV